MNYEERDCWIYKNWENGPEVDQQTLYFVRSWRWFGCCSKAGKVDGVFFHNPKCRDPICRSLAPEEFGAVCTKCMLTKFTIRWTEEELKKFKVGAPIGVNACPIIPVCKTRKGSHFQHQ